MKQLGLSFVMVLCFLICSGTAVFAAEEPKTLEELRAREEDQTLEAIRKTRREDKRTIDEIVEDVMAQAHRELARQEAQRMQAAEPTHVGGSHSADT